MLYLGLGYIGIGAGLGLILVGGAMGIGKLASAALEGTARQPEAAGSLQTMMIIPAAMIEGLGLLALVIALMGVLALNNGVKLAATSSATTQSSQTH
jgi:F-type H+-transporting ATPase subunit c